MSATCKHGIDRSMDGCKQCNFAWIANTSAFPLAVPHPQGGFDIQYGASKRELFALVFAYAEFLSCGSHLESAEDLADAAAASGQSLTQRMSLNAIEMADALLAELARTEP